MPRPMTKYDKDAIWKDRIATLAAERDQLRVKVAELKKREGEYENYIDDQGHKLSALTKDRDQLAHQLLKVPELQGIRRLQDATIHDLLKERDALRELAGDVLPMLQKTAWGRSGELVGSLDAWLARAKALGITFR